MRRGMGERALACFGCEEITVETMLIGVLGGALGGIVATLIAFYQTKLFDSDRVLADYNAVKIVRRLLNHKRLPYRSFSMMRHYIGGYSDDELRKLLVRAGAIRAISEDGRSGYF
jgi:hypothetical protein